MNPANVMKIQLSQIASQQGDTISFDVSSIQSLASANELFLIFYLSKDDEYNGYGTVIQLDPQTKQASIYADLNPEYTYLFYQNGQGQLQSLLWCIEVASRTSDGMFIAHAKSYGRGINEEDLQRFSQGNLPQEQPETSRRLTEEYTPQPSSPPSEAKRQSAPPPSPPPTPDAPISFTDTSTQAVVDDTDADELQLPPLPSAPKPVNESTAQPAAPPATQSPSSHPSQTANDAATTMPSAPAPSRLSPMPEGVPDIFGSVDTTKPSAAGQSAPVPTQQKSPSTPKQPVGRPPKPLLSDKLWPVSPQDFNWAKQVSRQPINEVREALQQKVLQQIRTNKPGLIEDWEFTGEFEKVFSALCTTYDIIPSLRHDILKSLLNGRVVEGVQRGRQQPKPQPGI